MQREPISPYLCRRVGHVLMSFDKIQHFQRTPPPRHGEQVEQDAFRIAGRLLISQSMQHARPSRSAPKLFANRPAGGIRQFLERAKRLRRFERLQMQAAAIAIGDTINSFG